MKTYGLSDVMPSIKDDPKFRFKVTLTGLFGDPVFKVKFQRRFWITWWTSSEQSFWGYDNPEDNRGAIAAVAQDMFEAYHYEDKKWSAANKTLED